jgi:hypothetical protein
MTKLFAGLFIISFMSCNNRSDSDTGTISDTVKAAAPVDTTAPGSDSVGTKMNVTTTSDTATKPSGQ